MELNSIIFPACESSLPANELFGRVIYIPQDTSQWVLTAPFVSSQSVSALYTSSPARFAKYGSYKGRCIPCLFVPCPRPSNKVVIYFHGNAEDAGAATDWLNCIAKYLNVHVVAVEYQGYGLYNSDGSPSESAVLEDAELVYRYVLSALQVRSSDVVLFGRSIGSGPACYLAAKHHPHSLVLMSAFTSLRAVVKTYVGSLLQYLVAERFNNKKRLQRVKCPVFIVHGRQDDVVPWEQAVELSKAIKGKQKLWIAEGMSHNTMDFCADFLKPLKAFYAEITLYTKPNSGQSGLLVFPLKAFNPPPIE